MKVKGIESASLAVADRRQPTSRFSPAAGKGGLRHPSQYTACLMALLLLMALALAPVAFTDDGGKNKDDQDKQQKAVRDKAFREAQKAMRKGKYEQAAELYRGLIDRHAQDLDARLGASFAYLKMQNYLHCFEQATEALKIDMNNARAHALAGQALLRSGYLRPAVVELQQALNLNSKEALAYGGASELDYFEGRINESRTKALLAHQLDPNEPDYLMTYARASSRAEDFKEAADAYDIFLQIAPESDHERRDRIRGLIKFYRQLSGLKVHDISSPPLSNVQFYLGSDRRPYMRVKINGREGLFVIDTGSGFTVISADAAKRLGIYEIARGGNSQGVGGTGKFEIIYGLIRSLQFGDVKVKMVPCFIRPFHGLEDRPSEERADGFIGLSILSHFITELDYQQNVMKLDRNLDRSAKVAPPDTTIIPFRTTQNGLISIETEFNGADPVNAILDSGASSTAISMAAVDRLKMRDQIIKGQTTNVVGAAGVTNNVEMLFLRNCRVADLRQNNLRALVLDFNAINETSGFEQSGILGGDFLRHFRVTIDFPRTQVVLQPHTAAVTKQDEQ